MVTIALVAVLAAAPHPQSEKLAPPDTVVVQSGSLSLRAFLNACMLP